MYTKNSLTLFYERSKNINLLIKMDHIRQVESFSMELEEQDANLEYKVFKETTEAKKYPNEN